MVKSITFTGESGYIGERYGESDKPVKPLRRDWRYTSYSLDEHKNVFNAEKFDADTRRYKAELKEYNKVKGKYKVPCSETLVGRRFEFTGDRINLIFGPNASGKSSILKAIAGHAFCEDGFSRFIEPLYFGLRIMNDVTPEMYADKLRDMTAKTSNEIEWDGSPIYFHNFDNRRDTGSLGDLQGSILNGTADEVFYAMEKNRISAGQNMFFQLHRLAGTMSRTVTYGDILEEYSKYAKCDENHPWRRAYEAQVAYYRSFPMSYDPNGQNTYLFDEIDKSMDILNIHALYTQVLPALAKKYAKQIIIISHSPVVLNDDVFKSGMYNFISMDEEYTEKCRKIMSK